MGDLYVSYEYYIASTQLVLAMLGMGATLRTEDFVRVLRFPRGLALGLACVLVASPVLALAIAKAFALEPGITAGFVLIAAVPGGTLSNIMTYFARGNVPLSISLTGAATAGCLVTTPLVLTLFVPGTDGSTYQMPVARISAEIFFFLLLPLLAGMWIGARFEPVRDRFSQTCIRASLATIAVMVVGAASAGRVEAGAYGGTVILAMVCFSLALFATGFVLPRAAGLPAHDAVATGIETAYRNTSLALLVKASVFPVVPGRADPFADQVFFVALLYAGMAMLIVLPPTLFHRRRIRRAELAATGGIADP